MSQIFVNYREEDTAFAAILLDETLAARFGANNVFRDSRTIRLGIKFDTELWSRLAEAKAMLAVIGPKWIAVSRGGVRRLDEPNDWVRREIAFALQNDIRVIPVLIGDTPMPAEADLPADIKGLASRQFIRLYPRNAHREINALADELASLMDPVPAARASGAGRSVPAIWNVPSRSLLFVGRDDLLLTLRDQVRADRKAIVCAVHGLGGVGKTQLIIEFAHRYAGEYDLVWWVNAEQPTLIAEQLATLGVTAGLVDVSVDTRSAAAATMSHLHTRTDWLIVFDNVPEAKDVVDWIPAGPGDVVITTRSPFWSGVAHPIRVNLFTRAESLEYLSCLTEASGEVADEVADQLGDLPLALAQAAGVMSETATSPDDYLVALKQATARVLGAGKPARYGASLAAAVRVALDRLAAADPSAAELAKVSAFLAADPIPLALFAGLSDTGFCDTDATAATGLDFVLRQRLSTVARFGLLQPGSEGYVMHRLTQAIITDLIPEPDRRTHLEMAMRCTSEAAPLDARSPLSWPAWAGVLPHLLYLAAHPVNTPELRYAFRRSMLYLRRRGEWQLARRLSEDKLQAWRTTLGDDDLDVLSLSGNLCAALWLLGEYEQALTLGDENLARLRKHYGDEHPDTLRAMSGLADTLLALSRFEQSRELHEHVLAARRQTLGLDHPDTLQSANSCAHSLRRVGEYDLARALDEDTYQRRQRVLGEDHPDTLHSANSLAVSLRRVGRFDIALALDQQTLQRRRRVLGEDHPITRQAAGNLAAILAAPREDVPDRVGGSCYCERN